MRGKAAKGHTEPNARSGIVHQSSALGGGAFRLRRSDHQLRRQLTVCRYERPPVFTKRAVSCCELAHAAGPTSLRIGSDHSVGLLITHTLITV